MDEPNRNPYAPPAARVSDDEDDAYETLNPHGRTVPAGNGASWLSAGWDLFKEQPLPWVALTIIYGVLGLVTFAIITVMAMIIPFFNSTISILMIVFGGGIVIACDNQQRSGALNIGDMFAGFQRHAAPLMLCGVLAMVINIGLFIVAAIPVLLFGGIAFIHDLTTSHSAGAFTGGGVIIGALLGGLILIVGWFLAMAALYFAPSLIVLHGLSPIEAIKSSFRGCMRNWAGGLIYSLILLVLAIAASIPLGLGWLVLVPLVWTSSYSAYRDIFLEQP